MTTPTLIERLVIGYKRQPARNKATVWGVILVIVLLLAPGILRQNQASNLRPGRIYFSEPKNTITPGLIFPIEIRVQTSGTAINAVSTLVKYDPLSLEVVSMTTADSFCVYYLNNSFDNIKGEISISCGLPNPGFQGDSIVVHLDMRAKVAGSTTIKFDQSQTEVLANDGHGNNIVHDLPTLPLTIKQLL